MPRRRLPATDRPIPLHVPPVRYQETTEWSWNGRNVTPGTELSIAGERGRFRFLGHVVNARTGAEWVEVIGGPEGTRQFRAFRPDRIRTVHRIAKTRQAAA